jgi:hypothetical protein
MQDVIIPAHQMMCECVGQLMSASRDHTRGEFPSVSAGLSFGGRRKVAAIFLLILCISAHRFSRPLAL